MCVQMKICLIVLMICCFIVGLAYAGECLKAEIEQLRAIETVTGSITGYEAAPGEFFKLSKVFIQKVTEEDFIELTEDKNPVVMPCTLIAYDKDFILGNTLKNSDKKVYLNHLFCAEFCVLGGASCSLTH